MVRLSTLHALHILGMPRGFSGQESKLSWTDYGTCRHIWIWKGPYIRITRLAGLHSIAKLDASWRDCRYLAFMVDYEKDRRRQGSHLAVDASHPDAAQHHSCHVHDEDHPPTYIFPDEQQVRYDPVLSVVESYDDHLRDLLSDA